MLTDWKVEKTSSPADQTEMNGIWERQCAWCYEPLDSKSRFGTLRMTLWFAFVGRFPERLREWTSQNQFATGFEPDVSHLRAWGSKTNSNLPQGEVVGKLDDCVHIGFLVG